MVFSKANLGCLSPATVAAALVVVLALAPPASGQIPTSPCTASMLTSFSPCMNFLSNSTTNMTTPTPGCCNSLKALATNGTGCLCQILSGGVPFRVPVNRTSAISLPTSCNMPGVPLRCNLATGAPAPAPGSSSAALSPTLAPTTASSPSPFASSIPTSSSPSPAEAPVSDTTPTATSPTATTAETPSTSVTPGRTSNPAASDARPSTAFTPWLLLVPVALAMMKYY